MDMFYLASAFTFMFFALLIVFGVLAVLVVSKYFLLKKMGEEGWKAIIPFYGDFTLYNKVWTGWAYVCVILLWFMIDIYTSNDLTSSSGYYVIYLISLLAYYLLKGMFACNLCKYFDKNNFGLVIGLMVPGLGNILMLIMGLSKDFVYVDINKTVLLDNFYDIDLDNEKTVDLSLIKEDKEDKEEDKDFETILEVLHNAELENDSDARDFTGPLSHGPELEDIVEETKPESLDESDKIEEIEVESDKLDNISKELVEELF